MTATSANPNTIKQFIGGKWQGASDGASFEVLNPETNTVLAHAAKGTAVDVDEAVRAAKAAFPAYQRTLAMQREAWLFKAAELLLARKDQFIEALIDEVGSPLLKAEFEFSKALTMMRAAAGMTRAASGKTLPADYPGRVSISLRSPIGVVAAITPFNVPLIKGVRLTANPLALGNTVVLLCSEEAPILASLLAKVYEDAGFPEGTFNLVSGFGVDIGDALTSHPDVAMVTFTGSSRIGRHIQQICAKGNKRVTLELGGKSPMLVLKDADLTKAVTAATSGIFTFQGQVCMGNSRIYVEKDVYEDFLAGFAAAAKKLGMGDLRDKTTIVGPIISQRQRERVKFHVEDAVAKGARVVAGGNWRNNRCEPTVLADVKEGMVCAREETFGPVVSVYKIDSYEDGLARANDTEYGLSSAIFTKDITKALHYAQNIRSGMCHVNASSLQDEPHVPFGGVGLSGFGKEGTEADIDAMTELKWVTVNN